MHVFIILNVFITRDVVLPNVISVGATKSRLSGDFVVGEVAAPENCHRSKQPDWKQKGLSLSKFVCTWNCQGHCSYLSNAHGKGNGGPGDKLVYHCVEMNKSRPQNAYDVILLQNCTWSF